MDAGAGEFDAVGAALTAATVGGSESTGAAGGFEWYA